MPQPSTFVDWDTNATHTTAVLAGHATDGFVEDEVPDSDELNQWMMLVGLWIRWLQSFAVSRWYDFNVTGYIGQLYNFMIGGDVTVGGGSLSATNSFLISGGSATWTTSGGDGYIWTGPNSAYLFMPVQLKEGQVISHIKARLHGNAGGNGTVTITLEKTDDTNLLGTSPIVLATLSIVNPPNSMADYSVALGSPETVDGHFMYWLHVVMPGANASQKLMSMAAQVTEIA